MIPRLTLNGPSDWDEWIEAVKILALAGKVWDYIDPSKDEVPALEEPLPPQPRNINAQAATFGQLSQEGREGLDLGYDFQNVDGITRLHDNSRVTGNCV
jgi:hypothetical protein